MDVLKRLPDEELNRLIQALKPHSPTRQLWDIATALYSLKLMPEEFQEKYAPAVPRLGKAAEELLIRVPLWAFVLFSLLVKAHPWFLTGYFPQALSLALRRWAADVKKQKRERNNEIVSRKTERQQTLGQIADDLDMTLEAVKGVWKRHKPKPT
jgi:hypothetical protein